ncbi:MAG TPA: hypothetical protein VG692_08395, partial [Gemmatimonadales bacterium]|nr:hypothetical protein [Gemmatimonadales bacterium]
SFNRRELVWPVAGWFAGGAIPSALIGAVLFVAAPASILTKLLGVSLLASVGYRHTKLGPIPISLGPEDADIRHGDWRQQRGGASRRRALEREIAHLALDGAGVVAWAAGWESLGADLGQHTG